VPWNTLLSEFNPAIRNYKATPAHRYSRMPHRSHSATLFPAR
jgi:hypothetical protein